MNFKITSLNKNGILFFGLLVHIITAYFSFGFHHADELFQVYEFAGYKLGLNSAADLPWEFGSKMRSGIEPLWVYCFTKALNFISITNPFTISFVLRLFQALLSFWAIVQVLNYLERDIKSEGTRIIFWLFGTLFWFLPYFHARLLSENFSSTLFLLGFVLCIRNAKSFSFGEGFRMRCSFGGVLMGLAFLTRFQIGFMMGGFLAWQWFMAKVDKKFFVYCAIGVFFSLGTGVVIDKWLYSEWTISWWNYLYLNFFKGGANQFGTMPVYFYLTESVLNLIPPFSVVIVVVIILFWIKFKKHVITWITLPFVLLQIFVPHKELRFLFPLLNFLPFMILYYFESVDRNKSAILNFIRTKTVTRLFVVCNFMALAIFSFVPASNSGQVLKSIYNITQNKQVVLLYKENNPYSNNGSLNYFRNKNLRPLELNENATIDSQNREVFYFSEVFNRTDTLKIKNKQFNKVYSNFPVWLSNFNFNGWMERSTFSIYKMN